MQKKTSLSSSSFNWTRIFIVWGLPSLYFLAFAFLNRDFFLIECDRLGDYPLLALEIERAGRFEALVGPYSRHGFCHPGPFSLYFFALAKQLLFFVGSFYGRYALAQFFLNWALMIAAHAVVFRHLGAAKTVWLFTAALIYFVADAHISFFADIWGPAMLPCAMLGFLVFSAALAAGDFAPFFFWSLAFAVLASNHLGAWPLLGVISLFALSAGIIAASKNPGLIARRTRVSIWSGAVVLAAAALPPLIDIVSRPALGNFGKIIHFSLYRTQSKPFMDALEFLVSFYDLNLGFFMLPGKVLLPLLALVAVCAKLPRLGFAWNLRAVSLASPLLALASVLRIRGGLHPFIMWHQYAAAVLLVVSAAYSLQVLIGRFRLKADVAAKRVWPLCVSIALAVAAMLWSLQFRPPNSCRSAGLFDRAVEELKLDEGRLYVLESSKGQVGWVRYALFALALHRRGFRFCVLPKWEFMFGEDLGCQKLSRRPEWRGKSAVLRLYSAKHFSLQNLPGAVDMGGFYARRLPE